jgi:CHASE2 domain-containing sensor protein/predicted Ser/Thr protein kinase
MLGQTLAKRYKLTRILGAGGFGQTYLAIDIKQSHQPPHLLNQCVVKQLKPASQDPNFLLVARRLFETEADTLKRLGSHDRIPKLVDYFEEDGEFYLVQEFIDGQSLEDEIKQAGKLSEAEIISLLKDVLPTLSFIHQHHVVHRDLKPDNLIRRRDKGDIVLIDFGAVKEIRTRLLTGEQTKLTIGIGTQGYTPSEQLSGKPNYSSDLYALGMTAIHALTGRSPTDLPEDFGSLDPRWQDYAQVSPGLAILLSKMTRHYIYQRYSSTNEVLHDLARLEDLPAEAAAADTYLETALPQPEKVPLVRWRMGLRAKVLTVAISTVLTSAFVLGLRQASAFVTSELAIHDWLVSTQPDLGADPRLLLVEITDVDLKELDMRTPSDEVVSKAIDNLQRHQPASIGLDLLRDIPEGEGIERLRESLKDPNVVVITKLGNPAGDDAIAPPPGMSFNQISFSDIVVDSDIRVRRALLLDFLNEDMLKGETGANLGGNIGNSLDNDPRRQPIFSLGTELAIRYLEQYRDIAPADKDILQLGDTSFQPLTPTFGGYQKADTAGHQLFLRYRSPENIAFRIGFKDVVDNNFEPNLVKDKIVLIGTTSGNSRDMFSTAYNTAGNLKQMPGVILHAQVTSQILSAVLDGETLPWALPDAVEIAWIVALTGIGSTLMILTQRGPVLIAFGVSGLLVTCLVSVICFEAGGWVPMSAPMSAFFLSAAGARISKSYQRRYWEAHQ